jgi:hypothetical protein
VPCAGTVGKEAVMKASFRRRGAML